MNSDSKAKGKTDYDRTRHPAPGLTASLEDYLTAVREACEEAGGPARQFDIAARMGVSAPCVSEGLGRLAVKGFVTFGRNSGGKFVYLTDKGRASAEKLIGRRQIIAACLASLGLPETDALAEAHLWEHGISDKTTDAMKAALCARDASRTNVRGNALHDSAAPMCDRSFEGRKEIAACDAETGTEGECSSHIERERERGSWENYLKAVFVLSGSGNVRRIDVARFMGVSKPSVSRMMAALTSGGYITSDADNFVLLTDRGHRTAERIYKKYAFFRELFVREGMLPDVAEHEARLIEHLIGDAAFEAMQRAFSGAGADRNTDTDATRKPAEPACRLVL